MRLVSTAGAALMMAAVACGPKTPPVSPSLDAREWSLVDLKDKPPPMGAGGRPATIHFDTAAHRASGFAGCNRYSAQYTAAGDSLTFGPAMATKMACSDGDALEREFFAVLPDVTGFQLADTSLTLSGAAGPLARFRAP